MEHRDLLPTIELSEHSSILIIIKSLIDGAGDQSVDCSIKVMSVHKDYTLDYTSPLNDVIMEAEHGSGGLTYRYTYGLQKVSTVISNVPNGAGELLQNGKVKLYYHHDRLGSTDFLTDNVKAKVTSYVEYDSWGALLSKAIVKLNQRELDLVQEYTGHPYDQVLGLYFAEARMYDAVDRRFVAMDLVKGSVTNPLSVVKYVYALNSPLVYTDPMGLVSYRDGKIAHITIQQYVKSVYPTRAAIEVKLTHVPFNVSGVGYADIVLSNKVGKGSQVFEIKGPGSMKKKSDTNLLGQLQLWSYIFAINYKNGTYSPAVAGTEVELNGVVLPFGLDATKVLILTTRYDTDPGMIYYKIEKKKKKHKAKEYELQEAVVRTLTVYHKMECVEPKDKKHPVDTGMDNVYWGNVKKWLEGVNVNFTEDGTRVFEFPDGVKVYEPQPSYGLMLGNFIIPNYTTKQLLNRYRDYVLQIDPSTFTPDADPLIPFFPILPAPILPPLPIPVIPPIRVPIPVW